MGLKTPEQYIESLRDGRVTFWDGERIDDITKHPRFKVLYTDLVYQPMLELLAYLRANDFRPFIVSVARSNATSLICPPLLAVLSAWIAAGPL